MSAGVLNPRGDFKRDRWDRPLILQPDGKELGYTRVTTLAKTCEEQSQLTAWKQRMTLLGASLRPDIVISAANARMMPDLKEQKKTLNRLASDAMEAAQAGAKASIGTALHGFSEHIDAGLPVAELPPMVQPIMASYSRLVARAHQVWNIRIVGVEERLVCEDVRAAGTTDRLWYFPHPVQIMTSFGPVEIPGPCVVVVDLKTGSVRYGGLGIGVQLGTYAASERYDVVTGARTPLGLINLDGQLAEVPVHQDLGLVLHLPSDEQGATAELLPVNIRDGYAAALESFRVREIRKASEGWIGGPMELTEASLPLDVPAPVELQTHNPERHNLAAKLTAEAASRHDLEMLWQAMGEVIGADEGLLVHYRLRWDELAPTEVEADGDSKLAYCTCDPRQRTGWTHDPELGVHVCSACRRPSRENFNRLMAGQSPTQVMTHPVSVPAGNGAVAHVPDRVQPAPVVDFPPAVEQCEHGLAVEACVPCTILRAPDPAVLAELWTTRPELRAQSLLFGQRGRELNEEWTRRIADATAEELERDWHRFACVPELEELGKAKWSLSAGGVDGRMIATG